MSALTLDFSRLKAQSRAFKAFRPKNRVALAWGRGCGKSWFVRRMMYLLVAQWDGRMRPGAALPGVRIVVLMPTLEQAKKVHGHLLLQELEASGEFGGLRAKVNKSTWTISFPGGSWIQFVTGERAHLLRGIRCDAVFIDEADDIEPGVVDAVVKPWFSEPHSLRHQLVAGTPRRGRKGLLYAATHEWPKIHVGRAFGFHATAYDAPTIVDPEFLAEAERDTDPEIFRREWLCDFDAAEGLVFPGFLEDFHVCEPVAGAVPSEVLVGGDWGFEDPSVFLTIAVYGGGRDAHCHIVGEYYRNKRTEGEVIGEAVAIRDACAAKGWPTPRFFYDPSRPSLIEEMKRAGLRAEGGNNHIEDGIATVADALHVRHRENLVVDTSDTWVTSGYARLYVSASCASTIEEFKLYRRKRDAKNPDVFHDAPEDRNNHAMDSLRYALLTRFGRPEGHRIVHPDTAFAA